MSIWCETCLYKVLPVGVSLSTSAPADAAATLLARVPPIFSYEIICRQVLLPTRLLPRERVSVGGCSRRRGCYRTECFAKLFSVTCPLLGLFLCTTCSCKGGALGGKTDEVACEPKWPRHASILALPLLHPCCLFWSCCRFVATLLLHNSPFSYSFHPPALFICTS